VSRVLLGHERLSLSPEEKAIIERCKRGDLAAFNELVKRYEKQVYSFSYRLTNNYDDASDIAQEAFLRVYSAIGHFRGDSSFTTWLYRITTNVFLDERKKARAHPQSSLDEYMELEESSVARQIEDPSPGPEAINEEAERNHIVRQAVDSLPDYQRAMVVLYHTQQKSYEEIAAIMDLPIGTVKSRLNRARVALKEKLSPLGELFNA
jgi:RNA polymerase sigma-70 factor, ECF subfamily